ncbi:MAG: T9SS type A sorting domain-containing protein, partial [bacterium]
TNLAIGAITSSSTHLYAGLSSGGAGNVWRRALSEVLSVELLESETIPTQISLAQNYPNPFNPSTTIRFEIPNSTRLTLKVFDVVGKEVATIASGEFNAGAYTATFDASSLSSGLYFYRLEAAGFSKTMKMILMK